MTEPTTRTPNRVVRAGWFVAGWVAVGIGGVGIVVPGLPTPFIFVVAAYCFGRSSPRFEQWVLDLPTIGPLVRDYRAGVGMTAKVKRTALTTMWIAITISSVLLWDRRWYAAVGTVALGVVGTWYIVARVPTKPQ